MEPSYVVQTTMATSVTPLLRLAGPSQLHGERLVGATDRRRSPFELLVAWLGTTGALRSRSCLMQAVIAFSAILTASLPVTAFSTELAEESRNAALQYWVAFALCPPETEAMSAATTVDERFGFGIPVSQELAECFQGNGESALVHLHRAAKLESCEWATDLRRDGPSVAAPYGRKAHAFARVALLRARWRFEHGDWDSGIEDVIATMMMGRHIGRGKIWYNLHFGCMIETMAIGTAAFYCPRMPEESRERLAGRLKSLPPFTSMREVALYYENTIDWATENFRRAEKEGRLPELVASICSKEHAKKVLAMAGDAEALCKLVEAGRPLAREIAEALSLRADEYDRVFQKRFAPRLDANPIAAALGPAYDLARGEESTAHCRLILLQTGVDVLRRGRAALNDHPDPYGDGPFEYKALDGGFELGSVLVYRNKRIRICFGVPNVVP